MLTSKLLDMSDSHYSQTKWIKEARWASLACANAGRMSDATLARRETRAWSCEIVRRAMLDA